MPTALHRAMRRSHVPLSVLENPFQLAVAGIGATLGALAVISILIPARAPVTALAVFLPGWLFLVWSIFMVSGGLGLVVTMLVRDRYPGAAASAEHLFLLVSASGWAAYMIPGLLGEAQAALLILGALLSLACVLRLLALVVAARITERVATISREVDDGP